MNIFEIDWMENGCRVLFVLCKLLLILMIVSLNSLGLILVSMGM